MSGGPPLIGIGADILKGEQRSEERAFGHLTYIDALRGAGAIPLLIPPQPLDLDALLDALDGIVLAGGNDCDPTVYGEEAHQSVVLLDRRRQSNDLALAGRARELGIPTLGICLGSQLMNIVAGGSIVQDIPSEVAGSVGHRSSQGARQRHDVMIVSGTKLASIVGEGSLNVNSSHHQAVRAPGHGLRVTARSSDGVVEGIEDSEHLFYLGVQWHPEDMAGEMSSVALFRALVVAARTYAGSKRNRRSDV
ncbi:MAG: gamma-glutamyl-gamma-aminobutyrate hydrolase family protein [Thermoanaerobaculia bacterium]